MNTVTAINNTANPIPIVAGGRRIRSDSFTTATEFQKLLSVVVIPGLSPFNNALLFSHFHVMRKQFINIVKLWELLLKDRENTKTSKPDIEN